MKIVITMVMAGTVALGATVAPAQLRPANPNLLPGIPGFRALSAAELAARARPERRRLESLPTYEDLLQLDPKCLVIPNLIDGDGVRATQTLIVERLEISC